MFLPIVCSQSCAVVLSNISHLVRHLWVRDEFKQVVNLNRVFNHLLYQAAVYSPACSVIHLDATFNSISTQKCYAPISFVVVCQASDRDYCVIKTEA